MYRIYFDHIIPTIPFYLFLNHLQHLSLPTQVIFKKNIHQVQLVLIRALLWGHGLDHGQPTRSHTLEEKGFSLSQHP